jgi:hypothetical protein
MGYMAENHAARVYPVILSFYRLGEYGLAQVALKEDSLNSWGETFLGSPRVGISLETSPPNTILSINRFVLNKKSIAITVGKDCPEIRIRLYAHACSTCLDGTIVLPSGASMKVESSIDRVILERGSFCLKLSDD